jgi:hypothetical protein
VPLIRLQLAVAGFRNVTGLSIMTCSVATAFLDGALHPRISVTRPSWTSLTHYFSSASLTSEFAATQELIPWGPGVGVATTVSGLVGRWPGGAFVAELSVHFGPTHPSAHGVLRALISLLGEWVRRGLISPGLLHRASEKLLEGRGPSSGSAFVDRLDYVSMLANEHSFVSSLECMVQAAVGACGASGRVQLLEVTRQLNHLLAVACHAGDLGCLTSVVWLFEDRECMYCFSTSAAGCRTHASSSWTAWVRRARSRVG